MYTVPGTSTNECPVSLITPDSRLWIELYFRSKSFEKMGVSLYGPDLSLWPSRVVDAIAIIDQELLKEQSLRRDITDAPKQRYSNSD